jgi:30S ribosome assembly GTPase
MDREKILSSILEKMYYKSIVIKVLDMANFEGSQIEEIYENVNLKKHKLLIVCNKIDALPKGFSVDRLQTWVKRQIEAKVGEDIKFHICLASAKEATGIQKVLDILEKIKKEIPEGKYLPKIYVVGSTNSGKSSFINSLVFKSNKYKEPNKIHYRSKYAVLTESPAPGTTLDLVSVEELRIGYKFLDTPGIPNLTQVSSLVQDYQDLMSLMPSKQISSYPINVKSGYSLWLGALARVDFLSGEDKFFTFFVPPHVTIHRTPILKAASVYAAHAGTLLRPPYTPTPHDVSFV